MQSFDVVASDPSHVYGLEPGIDVLHSTDGGVTWHGSQLAAQARSMAVDPADPDTVYVATSAANGVLRSTDGGQTWSTVSLPDFVATGDRPNVTSVALVAGTPETIYAVGDDVGDGTTALYSSTDGGQSWTQSLLPTSLSYGAGAPLATVVTDPTDAQHVIVSGKPRTVGQPAQYVSTDGGASWTAGSSTVVSQPQVDTADPIKLWAVGSDGVYQSTDGAATWTKASGSPAHIRSLSVTDGQLLVSTTDQGVARSTDGGATWQTAQLSVGATSLAPMGAGLLDPADPNRVTVSDGSSGALWSVEFSDSLPAVESYKLLTLNPASDVTPTSATLSANVAPLFAGIGVNTLAWDWGTGQSTDNLPATPTGQENVATHALTDLTPNTTYTVSASGSFGFPGIAPVSASAPASITFKTPPAVDPSITTAPAVAFTPGGTIKNGNIPARVAWSQTAGTYAIASSQLDRSLDGSWSTLASAAASPAAAGLHFGHSYQFRVQADDGHGNLSPESTSIKTGLSFKDDRSTDATWAGSWKRVKSTTALDKTLHTSASGTASVTLHFTGRAVAIIAPSGQHFAAYQARIDGHGAGAVSPSGTSLTPKRLIGILSFATSGKHTLVLTVHRTPGRTLAELDGFAILN